MLQFSVPFLIWGFVNIPAVNRFLISRFFAPFYSQYTEEAKNLQANLLLGRVISFFLSLNALMAIPALIFAGAAGPLPIGLGALALLLSSTALPIAAMSLVGFSILLYKSLKKSPSITKVLAKKWTTLVNEWKRSFTDKLLWIFAGFLALLTIPIAFIMQPLFELGLGVMNFAHKIRRYFSPNCLPKFPDFSLDMELGLLEYDVEVLSCRPLMVAVLRGDIKTVNYLLARGAEVNNTSIPTSTEFSYITAGFALRAHSALDMIAEHRYLTENVKEEIAMALINKGADIHNKNSTILYCNKILQARAIAGASRQFLNNPEVALLLFKNCAERFPDTLDNVLCTLADLYQGQGQLDTALEYVLQAGPDSFKRKKVFLETYLGYEKNQDVNSIPAALEQALQNSHNDPAFAHQEIQREKKKLEEKPVGQPEKAGPAIFFLNTEEMKQIRIQGEKSRAQLEAAKRDPNKTPESGLSLWCKAFSQL